MSALFVIGDVHGCIYTLESLVKKLPKDAGLIFVGDLVDKGKHSVNVIEFVKGNNYPCVYGNHEYLLFNYLRDAIYRDKRDSNWATKDGWGGAKTIENYKAYPHLVNEHIAWVEKLPRYIQKDRYFITHGFGLPYYMRKDHPNSKRPLLSNRIDETDKAFINDWEVGYEKYEVINIFGHCPFKEVLRGGNYYGIDTSCVYGGKLTALELGAERIVQVQLDKRDI